MDDELRQEHDSLGTQDVPASAYYGAQTARARDNFAISGTTMRSAYPAAIRAYAWVKYAAARANMELQQLAPNDPAENQAFGSALMRAATEMASGQFDDQFLVDVYQGGTGTSHHMNVNEILANRATEILGGRKGEYRVHPNDHANCGQSTNDVTPTVMRLTFLQQHQDLRPSVLRVIEVLNSQSLEFADIPVAGRTHMQDAVPLTFGQQFGAYAHALEDAWSSVERRAERFLEIGLGGTAVGTGLNTHVHYRGLVARHLSELSGFQVQPARDFFQTTSSFGVFSAYSSALRNLALELEKLAQDLKLYSSGPCSAIAELRLPAVQPGSSIMPGKVNPVYPELINQLSYLVQGNDLIVGLCAQNGQWQLNVMMPMVLLKISESQRVLTTSLSLFADQCLVGIKINRETARKRIEQSTVLLTALNPHIGYEAAAALAKDVLKHGTSVRQAALDAGLKDHAGTPLTAERLDEILSVRATCHPLDEQ